MPIDKSSSLMRFVQIVTDILNNEPEFFNRNQNVQYAYHFKIVDDSGTDVTKFTLGVKNGKIAMSPQYKPDVVITMLEGAFFDIIFGKQTVEEAYFAGEADIWAAKGDWTKHLAWIKESLDAMEKQIRLQLDNKLK